MARKEEFRPTCKLCGVRHGEILLDGDGKVREREGKQLHARVTDRVCFFDFYKWAYRPGPFCCEGCKSTLNEWFEEARKLFSLFIPKPLFFCGVKNGDGRQPYSNDGLKGKAVEFTDKVAPRRALLFHPRLGAYVDAGYLFRPEWIEELDRFKKRVRNAKQWVWKPIFIDLDHEGQPVEDLQARLAELNREVLARRQGRTHLRVPLGAAAQVA